MALAELTQGHHAARGALVRQAQQSALTLWSRLDPAKLTESWTSQQIGDLLYIAVSAAQMAIAIAAEAYVDSSLGEQGADTTSMGALAARSLAGVASDGRDLETLLYQPIIATKVAIQKGAPTARALQVGQTGLTMIVGTQVSDAGRAASSVAMASRPAVGSWVRVLTRPSCGRCAVLAGRTYRYNASFDRHPGCDCMAAPSADGGASGLITDPESYFDSLSPRSQDRYFTVAGAEAIRDGADVSQVVNARRGASGLSAPGRLTAAEQALIRGATGKASLQRVDVYGRQVYVTTEGTTRRGIAGRRLGAWSEDAVKQNGQSVRSGKIPRLMPESIYELAGDDRGEVVRLLRRFGYIA